MSNSLMQVQDDVYEEKSEDLRIRALFDFDDGFELNAESITKQIFEYTVYKDGQHGKDAIKVRHTMQEMYEEFNDPVFYTTNDLDKYKTHSLKYQEWFNAGVLKDYKIGRCAGNVGDSQMFVLDVDDGESIEAVTSDLKARGIAFILHTSKSYDVYKDGDRFRVIIFCLSKFSNRSYLERVDALKEMFPYVDPASWSNSQGFVKPLTMKGRKYVCTFNQGDHLFDFLALPRVALQSKEEFVMDSDGDVSKVVKATSKAVTSNSIDGSGSYGDRWFTPKTIFESEVDGAVCGEDVDAHDGIISAVKCLWHADSSGGGFLRSSGDGVYYKCNNSNCTASKTVWMCDSEEQMYKDRISMNMGKVAKLHESLMNTLDVEIAKKLSVDISKYAAFIGADKKRLGAVVNKAAKAKKNNKKTKGNKNAK